MSRADVLVYLRYVVDQYWQAKRLAIARDGRAEDVK